MGVWASRCWRMRGIGGVQRKERGRDLAKQIISAGFWAGAQAEAYAT